MVEQHSQTALCEIVIGNSVKQRLILVCFKDREASIRIISTRRGAGLEHSPALRGLKSRHGERWSTYHEIIGLNGKAAVVTVGWIYRVGQEDVPVLTTCYIERQGRRKLAEALIAN